MVPEKDSQPSSSRTCGKLQSGSGKRESTIWLLKKESAVHLVADNKAYYRVPEKGLMKKDNPPPGPLLHLVPEKGFPGVLKKQCTT